MENNITTPQEPAEHSTIGVASLVGTLISGLISSYGFLKAVSLGIQAAQSAQATGVETQIDDATAAKIGMVMLLGGFGAFVSAVVAGIAIVKDRGAKKISTAIAALIISGLGILGLILIMTLRAIAG